MRSLKIVNSDIRGKLPSTGALRVILIII